MFRKLRLLPPSSSYFQFSEIVDDDPVESESNSGYDSSDDSTWNMELPNVTDLSLDSSTDVPGRKRKDFLTIF
jgi:hypothetical protein